MNPVVTAVVVGVMTTLGRWARGKSLDINTVVGVVVLAVILSIIDAANGKLARTFGVLVIVGVGLAHLPIILKATGMTKGQGN
jgi:hypothetical protein